MLSLQTFHDELVKSICGHFPLGDFWILNCEQAKGHGRVVSVEI